MNRLFFLGTGTSTGVPVMGCRCETCKSKDPRDKRLRCSALIQTGQAHILLDCSPDFRQQMLRLDFCNQLDAVFITHEHYDHVGGIDDLRPYSYPHSLSIYADLHTSSHLKERLPYCLVDNKYPGVPQLVLHTLVPGQAVRIKDVDVLPFQVMHGQLPILGYRIGKLAYITDMTSISVHSESLLSGVEWLIVNGLRHNPHHSHQTIEEAVLFSRKIGATHTYIIHMSHHIDPHAREDALLPEGVHLAYDGLVVEWE